MSSLYVRETVRGWCANASGMLLPFHDTINLEVRKLDQAAWSTLVFVTSMTQTRDYCRHIGESGAFDFLALGAAGVGDSALIAACENDVAVLLRQVDPNGRLTLLRASPPEDFLQGGSTPYYTVSMTVEYTYEQPLVVNP